MDKFIIDNDGDTWVRVSDEGEDSLYRLQDVGEPAELRHASNIEMVYGISDSYSV